MVRSPEAFAVDPTYLEFFELTQSPFATLTEPDQQFQSEQYWLLMEHLEYAATNADSLVVVCGADGSGKSTLIGQFMATIRDRVSCVLIDAASDQGVVPFYSTLLTQIGFDEITGTEGELRNITKEFLVCRGIAGDHVLVIVDNTHLAHPRILEQIRRLGEVKIKDRRAISVVLFGNADIVRVVDAPAMRETVFPSHVGFNIRNYSEHETASYIWHRLKLAGANDGLEFSDAVNSLIHRYSGGVPHRINKLCLDVLQEAHRLQSRAVTTEIVRTVINRHQLLPHVIPLTRKGRRKSDPKAKPGDAAPEAVDPHVSQKEIAELAARVDDLESAKSHALQELYARDNAILSLRDEIDAQKKEAENLSRSLTNHAAIIARQNQALSDGTTALQDNEARVKRLAADLYNELRSRQAAQEELDKADAIIDALTRSKHELQVAVDAAKADLRNARSAADQRAVETEGLERTVAHSRMEIAATTAELDSMRRELAARNDELTDLKLQLESQALANRAAAITQQDQAFSDSTAALQDSDARVKHLAAELQKELRSRDAAQEKLDQANAIIDELTRSREELQAAVDTAMADLRSARSAAHQWAVETEGLETTTALLRMELAEKATDLESMRSELASRNEALTDLELQLEDSEAECEAVKSRIGTLKDPAELQALEQFAQKLVSDLETERAARGAAEIELVEATAAIQELGQQERKLQATARKLDAELKSSRERAFAAYALGRNVTMLQEALEERTSELNARTLALADLEQQVEALKNECESLRSRAAAAESRHGVAAEATQAEAEPVVQDRAYSSHVVALYERSLGKIPAYRTLKKYDPVFYDSLIKNYQTLVGQDLSDKQINDSLRAEQARWMERKLPGAADGAIVAYARLLVEQLSEFLLHGTEPCLSLLVPRANPDKGIVPIYSEGTRERELDILNMVLATYDVERVPSEEQDVWPILEPIFVALFEKYGADNVAAIENSFDPTMDRALIFNVSKALYSKILDLSEPAAAAALRWMFSVK